MRAEFHVPPAVLRESSRSVPGLFIFSLDLSAKSMYDTKKPLLHVFRDFMQILLST